MDTSKEYILMSEKAEEIQFERIPLTGDFYSDRKMVRIVVYGESRIFMWYLGTYYKYSIVQKGYFNKYIWLPRQDQLQEMVIDIGGLRNMIADFSYFTRVDKIYIPVASRQFDSMEQLWLAFVMSEKFNKTWKDGQWQKK